MATTPHTEVQIEVDGLAPDTLRVAELRGREAISQLFAFELVVVTADPDAVDAEVIAGATACLVFLEDGAEKRRIHGMLTAVREQLDGEASHATFRLSFGPRAFRLTMIDTLDIFMDLSVPEIVAKKLELVGLESGRDFALRLDTARYEKREFVVQYRETDLAFISRLTEHLGVSFFFEHDEGRDVLVFADQSSGFRAIEGGGHAHFRGRGERRDVYALEKSTRLIPAAYVVRDYNYRKPQLDLTAMAEAPDGFGGGVVEYGAHFKTPDEGQRLATIRAEEQRCTRRVYEGESAVPTFAAGAKCRLDGHPRGDLELLLFEVVHTCKQTALGGAREEDAGYRNTFRAIPAEVPFRPARVTPKPKVHGVLTGVIDASVRGQYAELDDEGRYRVRFLYDTAPTPQGRASRPLRMMQPHAGPGYGMHFPLRPGVEVLITCIDGDPDRPIIAGTVPNPRTASPVGAGNAPRNVLRTGGGNELNLDDTEGAERIKLTTPMAGTTFQLGAPNAPELGAILETYGASSTLAGTSLNAFSPLTSTVSMISSWTSSGNIYSVAEKADGWAHGGRAIQGTGQFVKSALDLASSGIALYLGGMEVKTKACAAIQAKADAEVDKAQEEADRATLDREAAHEKLELPAPEDPLPEAPSADPKQALANAKKAYDDATQKLAEQQAALLEAEAAFDELVRKNEGAGTNASIERAAQAKVEAERAVLAAKEALGAPGEGTAAGGAQRNLDDALAGAEAADPALAEQVKAYRAARDGEAKKAAVLAEKKRNAALAAKASADQEYAATKSTAAQGVAIAQEVCAKAKAGVEVLFSVATGVLSMVKTLVEKQSEDMAKEEATKAAVAALSGSIFVPADFWNRTDHAASTRQKIIDGMSAGTLSGGMQAALRAQETALSGVNWLEQLLRPKSHHVVGSADTTRVYGDQHVFVHGGVAAVFGKSKTLLASQDQVQVFSPKTAELAGKTGTMVTSRDGLLDLCGKKVLFTATADGKGTPPAADGDMKVVVQNAYSLETEKAGITLVAKDKDITLRADTKDKQKVVVDAKQVAIRAAEQAELVVGTSSGLCVDTSEVTLGNTDRQLRVTKSCVELGTPYRAQLELGDAVGRLVVGDSLTLGAKSVTFAAPNVSFGAAVVTCDDFMVLGTGLSAKLTQIQVEIQTAQLLAETAKKLADSQALLLEATEKAQTEMKDLAEKTARELDELKTTTQENTEWTQIAGNWLAGWSET
jgi:type VI secretion system secreted protein VgrG